MRLLDGEVGAGVGLVLRDEGRVDGPIELAGRVVRHVQKLERVGPHRSSAERDAEEQN